MNLNGSTIASYTLPSKPTRRSINAKLVTMAFTLVIAAGTALPVVAQTPEQHKGVSILLEEVLVAARKREETAWEVPLSITAYTSEQIEALKVRDLTDLSVNMPNVSLEDIATSRGIANFSIRGLGVNSSIPSIDPTVGVFINGVYLAINNGIIFDMFDLASIEVLRGPQGTLFGRNVTGGAVLINTKKPGDELEATLRYAVDTGEEGGINSYYMGAVGGPVSDDAGARLVLYYNDDEGPFENDFTKDDFGAIEQAMVRGTFVWMPTDTTELSVVYEYNDMDGDGPAAQSHLNEGGAMATGRQYHDRDSFNFSIDEEGYQKTETSFFVARVDQGINLGNGTVTGIFGHRDYEATTRGDIDSQPAQIFHSPLWLDVEQFTIELRYSGVFADVATVTVGAFHLDNNIDYHERREFGKAPDPSKMAASTWDGGGYYDVEGSTVFAQVDYSIGEAWTLTAGVNWSSEEKTVEVASLQLNISTQIGSRCNLLEGPACPIDFTHDKSWDNVAPKLGLAYHIDDTSHIYSHWTRGYRSGGYNLRNTRDAASPGPFDEEEANSFEVGFKSLSDWGKLNVAAFYMTIDDQQREINLPSLNAGVFQQIVNTADTTVKGLEADAAVSITDDLLLLASLGWLDAEYDKVQFDISGDSRVDGMDKALDLPRAPDLTWSLGLSFDSNVGSWGYMTSRVSWSYRDEFAYTDNNRGYVEEVDIVDAGVDIHSNDGHWVFSVYGRNLLDEVSFGGDTQLPSSAGGGTFAPLLPGRRYGLEVKYNFMDF